MLSPSSCGQRRPYKATLLLIHFCQFQHCHSNHCSGQWREAELAVSLAARTVLFGPSLGDVSQLGTGFWLKSLLFLLTNDKLFRGMSKTETDKVEAALLIQRIKRKQHNRCFQLWSWNWSFKKMTSHVYTHCVFLNSKGFQSRSVIFNFLFSCVKIVFSRTRDIHHFILVTLYPAVKEFQYLIYHPPHLDSLPQFYCQVVSNCNSSSVAFDWSASYKVCWLLILMVMNNDSAMCNKPSYKIADSFLTGISTWREK